MFNWPWHRNTDPETSRVQHETTKARGAILRTLRDGPFNAGEISVMTGVKRDAITPELNRLNMSGCVKKTGTTRPPRHDPDGRSQQVWAVTTKGLHHA